ncbi:MAG: hypothetical protein LW832_10390 [Parachlamydia sp.]|jgi:hypothetical protein|nr:hypothetical protein [Parachlamydia sp.]
MISFNFSNLNLEKIDFNLNYYPFDQMHVWNQLNNNATYIDAQYNTLKEIAREHGGLCEIICNCILADNLIGKATNDQFLFKNITIKKLNSPKIKNSHLLKIHTLFRRALAFLFGLYPNNLFSYSEQRKLVYFKNKTWNVNRQLISDKFANLDEKEVLKFEVFKRGFFSARGHSMLIQKTSADHYLFFDPNNGEYRELTFDDLINKINQALLTYSGNEILLFKGSDHLKHIKSL